MKAMILKGFGGIENFSIENIPEPKMNESDILIHIKAISIAPIDIKTRQGSGMADTVKKENPMLIGGDVAGEVVKKGNLVKNLKTGDAVFGTINFHGP